MKFTIADQGPSNIFIVDEIINSSIHYIIG